MSNLANWLSCYSILPSVYLSIRTGNKFTSLNRLEEEEDAMDDGATPPHGQLFHSMDVLPTFVTDNFKVHILFLHDDSYVLAREISHLFLQSDELQSCLDEKGIYIPTLTLNKNDDAVFYLQLLK